MTQQLILERIDLLGDINLRCPSVIKVEGSHSYKAIAFIRSKSNPRNTRLKTKNYFTLRRSLQKAQVFLKNTFSVRKPARKNFNKNLGDEKWIK
jgi:hypothetical protein